MKRTAILMVCAMTLTASAAPRKGGGKGRPNKGAVNKKREAKKHLEAATKAHEAEQFDVALTELQAAYELDPQPDTMYAIGQVQVKLNNCPEAIMAYEKFLESNPGEEPAALANEKITTCRAELAAQQPPPPPPPDPQPQPVPPPERKAFYKDPIGDGLVVVGIGASVAGVIFYMGARSRLEDADTALSYAEQRTIVEDAKGKRNLAIIAGGVGVAALGLGVWRWTTVGKSGEQHRVALVPRGDGGGMITWAGTF
jgi:tetratricopeptide (TPR) repeat protein